MLNKRTGIREAFYVIFLYVMKYIQIKNKWHNVNLKKTILKHYLTPFFKEMHVNI